MHKHVCVCVYILACVCIEVFVCCVCVCVPVSSAGTQAGEQARLVNPVVISGGDELCSCNSVHQRLVWAVLLHSEPV